MPESAYPYHDTQGSCNYDSTLGRVCNKSYSKIYGDIPTMRAAVDKQVVTTYVDASHKIW